MKGDYPRFRLTYTHEELVEHFLLPPDELRFVSELRGDANRSSAAVLLKSLQYLGYFPPQLEVVPEAVRLFIARQLNLLWDPTPLYPWNSGTRDAHLALLRKHTGWRFPTAQDKATLEQWLRQEVAAQAPVEEELLEQAYERLRRWQIELPAEKELRRLVGAALHGFFQHLYTQVHEHLSVSVTNNLDRLLMVGPADTVSSFEQLKATPSNPGLDHLKQEIGKLQSLRATGVSADHLAGISDKALQLLKRRATNERAGEMREHPAPIRLTLMACFVLCAPVKSLTTSHG